MMMVQKRRQVTYREAGVDIEAEEEALREVVKKCHESFVFRKGPGSAVIPISHFSGVVKISEKLGLAVKTDGVGSKVLIAQLMEKYDTVGIDCVAMNVNDVVCVGAEPLSFVDYIAVQKPDPLLLKEIASGLVEGARRAKVAIVGGEIAQLPEIIQGSVEGRGFDLAGMCIGLLPLNRLLSGEAVREGDVVVGFESSGIHSNGLTLARKVLLEKAKLSLFKPAEGLDRPLGEELLEPTRIYVAEALEMLDSGLQVKAMAHITGKGLLNLGRIGGDCGFLIENLPPPPPIFNLIQSSGKVAEEEMYRVFNMGIGFCAVIPKEEVDLALKIAEKHGGRAHLLGKAVKDPERRIRIKPKRLVGVRGRFEKY
jgi:phosphoribosylformylglycinamidine cyclo-ligase